MNTNKEIFTEKDRNLLAKANGINVQDIKEYKLRAEFESDIDKLVKTLGVNCLKVHKVIPDPRIPDADANLLTTLELDQLRDEIRKVDDSHIMLQSVALKDDYTGERYYHGS